MQTFQPFGFRPFFHPSGSANPRQKYGPVQTPPLNSLYTGQPLQVDSSGNFVPAVTFGTPNEVAPVKGIFGGIEYADQNGFVQEAAYFPAGTVTFNSAASGVNLGDPYSTFVKPVIWQDPQIEFQVQANGTLNPSAIGQSFDIDPSTIELANITGISAVALNATPVAGGNGNFIVTELAEQINNQWGDPYTIVLVKFNLTQF